MAPDHSDRIMTGLFRDRQSAERGYASLKERGYGDRDVSVLMAPETRDRWYPKDDPTRTELGTKAGEGAAVGAVSAGGIGALLAGLAAAGIAVPGLPILAAGPLAAALAGGATGGVVGAIVGFFIGRGIPEERAKFYEKGIGEGGMVMGITPRSEAEAEEIDRAWTTCGCEQIYRPTESAGRRP